MVGTTSWGELLSSILNGHAGKPNEIPDHDPAGLAAGKFFDLPVSADYLSGVFTFFFHRGGSSWK
jgi:hypothetical protein